MRALVLGCVLAACSACAEPAISCDDEVHTGEYELTLIPIPNLIVAQRFELAPDGAFAGFTDEMANAGDRSRCEGTLTLEEHESVTRAINDASLFCLEEWTPVATDGHGYEVSVRRIAESRVHRFCGFRDGQRPAFDRLVATIDAPLDRLRREGACAGPPYALEHPTCR